MSTVIDYKGLSIVVPDPTGDGGALVQNNFKKIADILATLQSETDIDSGGGGGGVDPDSVTTQNILADAFTLTHNNKKILNLTSDGGTYSSLSIDPGTLLGQRLLIVILPGTNADLTIGSGLLTKGNWHRLNAGSRTNWLQLIWDGTSWDELARDDGSSNVVMSGAQAHAEGEQTTASGQDSHAEGQGTQATQTAAHAEGMNTVASGNQAHAEGSFNTASGDNSHAEGSFNNVSAANAHVEGANNVANQASAHAEGTGTTASGGGAHSEGNNTQAIGTYSHAEGVNSQSPGDQSHAEGINTQSIGAQSHAEGNASQAAGNQAHAEGNNTRANGDSSHAEGDNTSAAVRAHAEGTNCAALSDSAHAEGQNSQALGVGSHSEGNSLSVDTQSHAEGNSHAVGLLSHSEGGTPGGGGKGGGGSPSPTTFAVGDSSHAEGTNSNAGHQGFGFVFVGSSVAITGDVTGEFVNGFSVRLWALTGGGGGDPKTLDTTVSSAPVFSGGQTTFSITTLPGTQAQGFIAIRQTNSGVVGANAHSEGLNTVAGGTNSHSEGNACIAAGADSHAEGDRSDSWGISSHSEGRARAVGDHAHAEGGDASSRVTVDRTIAAGHESHAEGSQTTAGNKPRKFTISGGVVTVTNEGNPGNFTSEFQPGQQVRFFDRPNSSNVADVNVLTSTFDGTNTHLTISPTGTVGLVDGVTGYCVYTGMGVAAHAEGLQTQAQGPASHSEGQGTTAVGQQAHAEGNNTIARNDNSHAEGDTTTVEGVAAHAEGFNTMAVGDYSHAEGSSSMAFGSQSHSESNGTAVGIASHAEADGSTGFAPRPFTVSGSTVTISGVDATQEFLNGDLVEFYALVGGVNNTLFAIRLSISAVAFGGVDTTFTIAGTLNDRTSGSCVDTSFGNNAHAEGSSRALGSHAHAEGNNTLAQGNDSHSEGVFSQALQPASHARGDSALTWKAGSMEGMSAEACGAFVQVGDAQLLRYLLRTSIVGASYSGPTQAQSPDNFIMRAGSGYAITVTIYAKEDAGGGGQHAMFKRMLIIDTTGFIVTTTIGTDIGSNGGAPPAGWGVSFLNNGINLQANVTQSTDVVSNTHWLVSLEALEINGL